MVGSAESALLTIGSLILGSRSSPVIERNVITSSNSLAHYYLINASLPIESTFSDTLLLCHNVVNNDVTSSIIPDRFLRPQSLAKLARPCFSWTLTATASFTSTYSLSTSQSRTDAQSRTLTHFKSPSTSVLVSDTGSIMLSASQSKSSTFLVSGSESVSISKRRSVSDTGIGSASPTLSAASPSISYSYIESVSESLSATFTCRELININVEDVCEIFRPLSVDWVPPSGIHAKPLVLDASWRFGNHDCASIRIPFKLWSGRNGALFTIGIVGVDSRVPLRSSLTSPLIAGTDLIIISRIPILVDLPITLLFADAEEVLNATQRGVLLPVEWPAHHDGKPNVTNSYLVAVVTMQYIGAPTLNQLEYKIDCDLWTRCPIPMSAVMEVRLEAAGRLFPVTLDKVIQTGTTIVTVGGSLTLSPSVVAQFKVSAALKEMSRCAAVDLDDANAVEDTFASGSANPFGISVGSGSGRRYVRGTLIMSVIYLVGLSALMFLFTTSTAQIRYYLHGVSQSTLSRPALFSGYPSALIAVTSFVMDASVGAGVVLGILGDGWADIVAGWLVVLLGIAFVVHILYVTTIRFPVTLIPVLVPDTDRLTTETSATSHDGDDARTKQGITASEHWRRWLFHSTHQWSTEQPAEEKIKSATAEKWLTKYESYIADVTLKWYCGLEQAVALLVCLLGALPLDELPFCISRGVLCFLLLGAQLLIMILRRPPVHRWRWLFMSVVLSLQTVTASLSVANAPLQEQSIELWMEILGAINFLLLAIVFVIDTMLLLRELYRSMRASVKAYKRRPKQDEVDDGHQSLASLDCPLIATNTPIGPPLVMERVTSNEAEEEGEEAIVRAILRQFGEYELAHRNNK